MKIILGPASVSLAEKVAESLRLEKIPVASRTFPDGESYVRLEKPVNDSEAVIVQTTGPPQDTRIIQLALLADAAKRNGVEHVTAVVPYLGYARQDKVFLQGETISIEVVARMLKTAGVDKLLTVNVHQEKVLAKLPFPAESVSAIPLLAGYFRQKGLAGAFALAPDKGALHLVEEAKGVLKGECGFLEKQRDRYSGLVSVEKRELNVKGKVAIIFDDIISSGGTIVATASILKDLGAKDIFAACVHPLLVGDAEKRILQAGVREIVGTDTVQSSVAEVSVAPVIASKLAG